MMPGMFDDLGAVMPGSLLGAIAARVVPEEFHWWRLLDRASSTLDPGRMRLHMAVDRWAQDERAMPRRLFLDVLEHLYRNDEFMAGRLQIEGARIGPANIVAPVLAITDPDGRVVPEAAVRPALAASRSRDLRIIPWRPEPGTALRHVSALVGPDAHARLWPAALAWARAHALDAD
jgi:polyhydroxyalkanoate synthase